MTIQASQLALYFSPSCPYCHRVLNALSGLGFVPDLDAGDAEGITLKNTLSDPQAAAELKSGGGKSTVPCLLIAGDTESTWMYESLDIIDFLQTQLHTRQTP